MNPASQRPSKQFRNARVAFLVCYCQWSVQSEREKALYDKGAETESTASGWDRSFNLNHTFGHLGNMASLPIVGQVWRTDHYRDHYRPGLRVGRPKAVKWRSWPVVISSPFLTFQIEATCLFDAAAEAMRAEGEGTRRSSLRVRFVSPRCHRI